MNDMLYKDECFRLVGLCMEIHRTLGRGQNEVLLVSDPYHSLRIGAIADEVARDLDSESSLVVVCGGLGPTHDDVSIAGVALAMGVPVVRHPALRAVHLSDSAFGGGDAAATARALAAAIRRREISPTEIMDATLDAIERRNPALNAIVWLDPDDARARARTATERVVGDDDLPPFLGVPLPIKDLTAVEGWPCTYGSPGASRAPAATTTQVVGRLESAGFVLCGRSNTPEFGTITATENDRYGITRNPWNTDRTPGGSSGGASAAGNRSRRGAPDIRGSPSQDARPRLRMSNACATARVAYRIHAFCTVFGGGTPRRVQL